MDLPVFNNIEDLTLKARDDLHKTGDLALPTQDTLPSIQTELQDSTYNPQISDQEFVNAPDSAGLRSKIMMCRHIAMSHQEDIKLTQAQTVNF